MSEEDQIRAVEKFLAMVKKFKAAAAEAKAKLLEEDDA